MTDETITPEQLKVEGELAYHNQEYADAADLFQAALEGFRSKNDQVGVNEMANSRGVVLMHLDRFEEALQMVEGTDAFFASIGDQKRQAMALGNKASILEKMKRYDEALAAYKQCAEIFKEIGEKDMRAPVMKSISALQFRKGEPLDAVISMDAGLQAQKDPTVAQSFLKKLIDIPMKWFTKT